MQIKAFRQIFIICILPILFGCYKHNSLIEENTTIRSSVNFSIDDAKLWFTGLYSGYEGREATNGKRKISKITPLWGKAVAGQSSKYELIETPVQIERPLGFKRSFDTATNGITNYSTLLILKSKKDGIVHLALMHVIPDKSSKDVQVTYLKKGSDFSGYVFFTSIDGKFINGWKYRKGNIVSASHNKEKRQSATTVRTTNENCETFYTDWYERICTYYTDGTVQCTEWDYIDTTYEEYCDDSERGGGSGGGSGDGEIELMEDLYQTCPDNFTFASVTTNNLWQEAKLTNIYCNLIYMSPGGTIALTVTIPQLYFGVANYNIDGNVVFTANQAKAMSATALNEAEFEMREYFKANPGAGAVALQNYWVNRIDYWMKTLSGTRAAATRVGAINPSNPAPSRPYDPCI